MEAKNLTTPNKPRRIRGAIFDLDGTLLDTMVQWNSLGIEYLRSLGIEPKSDFIDRLAAMSLRESAKFFKEEYGVPADVYEIVDAMKDRLRVLYESEARVKPNVDKSLRVLKRNGVEAVVATATSEAFATAGLRLNGLLESFRAVLSCKDARVGVGKSSPKVYDVARSILGTSLDETVVVEDALYAIQTAKAAGYFVVAIDDESERARRDVIRETADVWVADHSELADWLAERSAD